MKIFNMKQLFFMMAYLLSQFAFASFWDLECSQNEEDIILFVDANPDIDYAVFMVKTNSPFGGTTLVMYATENDFPRLLSKMEEKDMSVSRYSIEDDQLSPVEVAIALGSISSLEYLVTIRPDWVARKSIGNVPPVWQAFYSNDTNSMIALFNAGADVNTLSAGGDTLMQAAAMRSMDWYLLIRQHGGMCVNSRHFLWNDVIFSEMINYFMPSVINIYSDRIVFSNGTSFPFLGRNDVISDQLKEELRAAGDMNGGTVLCRVHPNSRNINYLYLEPVFQQLNIAALYIPEDGYEWGTLIKSYIPTLP